jgi:predicted nucleotidyltransferase
MGNELDELRAPLAHLAWVAGDDPDETAIPIVTWLDARSAAQVKAIVAAVARAHPEVVAAILFGSVARHDERPLDDTLPSDVDLLLLLDPTRLGDGVTRYPLVRELTLYGTIGEAADRVPDAPREIQILLVERDLARWDETLIANVAHDGLLLWARDGLPQPWRHLAGTRQPDAQLSVDPTSMRAPL